MDSVTKQLIDAIDPFGAFGEGSIIFDPCVFTRKERIQIGAHCRIDSFSKLEGGERLILGDYVHVASFAHLNIGGGKLTVENGAAFASGCRIITGGNHIEGRSMSAVAPHENQKLYRGEVHIGEDACVLTGAIVLPYCHIGKGARLAAGSVLTQQIPSYEVWAGVPAQRVGYFPHAGVYHRFEDGVRRSRTGETIRPNFCRCGADLAKGDECRCHLSG